MSSQSSWLAEHTIFAWQTGTGNMQQRSHTVWSQYYA
ncbi:hypothetical protein HNQ50_003028 [Silvimonas terrae]|uniref:Uncharacterized protein n=1 Tax=Silvimonas terrae TaxID=300266 RepID=A0A840RGV5_9NEIS|nr:hypothetical protein [Silvimonas terrae]